MNAEDRTWLVGELAEATPGSAWRSLHHYDAIGPLQPSRRSGAGRRLYSEVDVRRLHRIVALRGQHRRLAEEMTPEEFAAASEARQKAVEEISEEELEELTKRRVALMPEE